MIREPDHSSQPARRLTPDIPIYSTFARHYDQLIGDNLFPAIRDSFEECRQRFNLRFESAADIGCGTGRFLCHLLRDGIPLFGIDASPAVLRIAARRLATHGVPLLCQDMRKFHLPCRVDLITCNGDTLNYLLSVQDLTRTLSRCKEQLNPGGYLVGDFLSGTPIGSAEDHRSKRIRLPGVLSSWRWQTDPIHKTTAVTIHFARFTKQAWQVSRETHKQRWYAWPELRAQLVAVGMEACRAWPMPTAGGAGAAGTWLKFMAQRLH